MNATIDKPISMKWLLVFFSILMAARAFPGLPDGGPYQEIVDGIEWTFMVSGGESCLGTGEEFATAIPRSTAGSVKIPVEFGGHTVTCIKAYAFCDCMLLESIDFPTSVSHIAEYAFVCCVSLQHIVLPPGITRINGATFMGCDSLEDVELNKGLIDIGDDAFSCCTSIRSIDIPVSVKSIGECAFMWCSSLATIEIPAGVTNIGFAAFNEASSMQSIDVSINNRYYCSYDGMLLNSQGTDLITCPKGKITAEIPLGVTNIQDEAFTLCEALQHVSFPAGIERIGSQAFNGCTNLQEIVFSDGVRVIEENAFYFCQSMASVSLPASVEHIADNAFFDCGGIREFIVSEANTEFKSVNGLLLNKDGTELHVGVGGQSVIVVPDGVTNIFNGAFMSATELRHITLPNGVTRIGDYAFERCNLLESIFLPATVTDLAYIGLQDCRSLLEVVVDKKNETYQTYDGMLLNASSSELIFCPRGKTSATIPDTVYKICDEAFSNCNRLSSVDIPCNVRIIGDMAFYGCSSLHGVMLPWCLEEVGTCAFDDCDLLDKIVAESWWDHSGLCVETCWWLRSFDVPNRVRDIGMFAFSYCSDLRTVTLPEIVTNIGDHAFDGCGSLKTIVLPKTLESIGAHSFSGCANISTLAIPGGVTNIGAGAFEDCYSMQEILVDPTNRHYQTVNGLVLSRDGKTIVACPGGLNKVIVPDGVEAIFDYAFSGCSNLSWPLMPLSLSSIGEFAFSGCHGFSVVDLPENVRHITGSAFTWCSNLRSIYISKGNPFYRSIDGVLYDRTVSEIVAHPLGLLEVAIMPETKSIGPYAFTGHGFPEIKLPEGITNIDTCAFMSCSNLQHIDLPRHLVYIGDLAFAYNDSLSFVSIPSSVISIGNYAFDSCYSLCQIEIEDGVKDIGEFAFLYCRKLERISLPKSLCELKWGVFEYCETLREAFFPASITNIGHQTFYGCRTLSCLNMSANVCSIGSGAFAACDSLAEISLPINLKSIWGDAFWEDYKLTNVVFGGDAPSILSCDLYSEHVSSNLITHVRKTSTGWGTVPGTWQGRPIDYIASTILDSGITGGKAVEIENAWAMSYLDAAYGDGTYDKFITMFGNDPAVALTNITKKADTLGNPMFVWQDYVTGTDPTNPDDKFTASITLVDGVPVVSYTPELTEEQKALRTYKTFGKKQLQDVNWADITNLDGESKKPYNFFKVTVEMK